jgi:acyl-CoA hydrolase
MGVSLVGALPAAETANFVIAQINPNMPRTHGAGFIHVNDIDVMVENDDPIPEQILPEPNDIEMRIGRFCTELVDNGQLYKWG